MREDPELDNIAITMSGSSHAETDSVLARGIKMLISESLHCQGAFKFLNKSCCPGCTYLKVKGLIHSLH